MTLASGTRLGPYEIQSPLGAGGMGEVYRARDTRLGRDVAIKVLPSHLSSDLELQERFQREARAISSLNHPHICTLHDVGHQDGVDFLVMEYLEGETLQQRLLRGTLPLKQALELAIQVADALALAHQSGIAHRDLKPGNIMLTKSGAKLLDFGLAKPVAAVVMGPSSAGSLTPSTPTMTLASMSAPAAPLTERGKVVGTFQYIAPEVLQGEEADARSDIFALGTVLFEMITGKHPFAGKGQLSILTAILERDPEPMPLVSRSLEHVIHACMAKDPAERWQSTREVARELRWVLQSGPERTAAAAQPSPTRSRAIWPAIVLATIAVTGAATYFATRPAPASRFVASLVPPAGVFPDTSGRNGPPQISPDGSALAFTGCKSESASKSIIGGSSVCSVWVRSLRSADAREIAGTSGGYAPFWSPDGREIGFFADGKLKRVAVDGGPVQIICDAGDARGGSWGSSGTIIYSPLRAAPIYRVPAEGGTPTAVTHSTATSNIGQMGSHRWPHFLPDGEHLLYLSSPTGSCGDQSEIRFASLDGKQDMLLLRACSSPVFANGKLIYWREGNLAAQPLDPGKGTLSGAPVPIADHVAADALFGSAAFSASGNGTLVYRSGEGAVEAQLVWYDRTRKMLGVLGENNLYDSVAVSPDGSRVVTNANASTRILVIDARGSRSLVTCGSSLCTFPVWSADGREVYYASNAKGPYNIYAKAADGSGGERPVVTFPAGQLGGAYFLAASPDGKHLAYSGPDPESKTKRMRIFTVALAGDHAPQPFLEGTADESVPAFSPDGKWLAYESMQSGRNEVYVTPFPAAGAQYQVSTNGGERPVWRHDGREIFYRENLRLMAVKVTPKSNAFALAPPEALFEVATRNLNGRWYDVSPDGRFLMNTSPTSALGQNFELVVNWPAQLTK